MTASDDLAKFNRIRVTQDTVAAFRAFTTREVEQGTRFHYASNQTVALTLLMRAVTGTTLSEYLTQRLWQPMGAEADATWIRTRDGTESGGGNFNAVLRDYGRLGILLANDGAVGGKQIVPKEYLLEATDWRRQPEAFAPRRRRRFSATAISSGFSRVRSDVSRCSASTVNRSSSIPNSSS